MVGGVRFERVALLSHDVDGGQSLRSLEERLIETSEDVSLELQEEEKRERKKSTSDE